MLSENNRSTLNHIPHYFSVMKDLLWAIAAILLVGWLIGYIGFGQAVGSFIHILLVLAVIAVLIRLISGRNV